MPINTELKNHLRSLADKYEKKEFLVGDPSWFMHQIEGETNRELLAFIASALSYGSRKQFLPKIQLLLDDINKGGGNVAEWLRSGSYERIVTKSSDAFYRLYSYNCFNRFLAALAAMVDEYGSIKAYLSSAMKTDDTLEAVSIISQWFHTHGSTEVVPRVPQYPFKSLSNVSSCKRLCMFLRWMVRTDSPVDLGLWSGIIDRKSLVIPMDTHVVQEAMKMGLLSSKSTSMSNALKLSEQLAKVFPDDPIKGDFALFGLGVDLAE